MKKLNIVMSVWYVPVGTLALALVGGLLFLIGKTIEGKKTGENISNSTKEINKIKSDIAYIQKVEADSKTFAKEIVRLEAEKEELQNEIGSRNQALLEYKTNVENEIKYQIGCTKEIYRALVEKYSPLLDVRDWSNLDLVIYYLETRRAISVREALQLVDKQHQTEAMVNTLRVATEQIKDTIAYHSQKIQSAVYETASVISGQLNNVSRKLNAISVNQDITNSYLRNLSSEVTISNALRTQANKSSQQMMEDIKQIRTYAENDAISARNS